MRRECPFFRDGLDQAAPQPSSDMEVVVRSSVGKSLQGERPDSGLDEWTFARRQWDEALTSCWSCPAHVRTPVCLRNTLLVRFLQCVLPVISMNDIVMGHETPLSWELLFMVGSCYNTSR